MRVPYHVRAAPGGKGAPSEAAPDRASRYGAASKGSAGASSSSSVLGLVAQRPLRTLPAGGCMSPCWRR